MTAIKVSATETRPAAQIEALLLKVLLQLQKAGLQFHHTRVLAELCNFYLRAQSEEKLILHMVQLVEECAKSEFFWVFKSNSDLKSALYNHRDDLGFSAESAPRAFIDKFLSGRFDNSLMEESNILSMRERQVLGFLAEGMSNKAIALKLDLTDNTVKFHLKNIFSKLSVSRRGEAVFAARRMGLI